MRRFIQLSLAMLLGGAVQCTEYAPRRTLFTPAATTNADFHQHTLPVGRSPRNFSVQDGDGDGDLDIAVANYQGRSLTVLRQTVGPPCLRFDAEPPCLRFEELVTLTPDPPASPTAITWFDPLLSAEGRKHLAVLLPHANALSVFSPPADGDPITDAWREERVSFDVSPADLRPMRWHPEPTEEVPEGLILTLPAAGQVITLRLDGDGNDGNLTVTQQTIDGCQGNAHPVIGEFDGAASFRDMIVLCPADDTVLLLAGQGDGAFVAGSSWPVSAYPGDAQSADFNGDGHADLAVLGLENADVSIKFQLAEGGFAEADDQLLEFETGATRLTLGSFATDGSSITLLSPIRAAETIRLFHSPNDGEFTDESLSTSRDPFALSLGDYNHDGTPDLLALESNERQVSIYHSQADQSFVRSAIGLIEPPESPLTIDLDGDGDDDVLMLQPSANRLLLLENRHDANPDNDSDSASLP